MENVPSLKSLTSLFNRSKGPTPQGPTHGTDDTALSPSEPPLTLQGVGTYDPSVGVPLALAEEIWKNADDETRGVAHILHGMGIDLNKDGSGTFKKGNTHGTYQVKGQFREIRLETVGPDGITYSGMNDELIRDGYDEIMGRPGRERVSVFYRIPPTKAGDDTQVGLQWVSPYVPTDALAGPSFVTKRRHLIVPSATFDASKYNPDDSLNIQKLRIAKPCSRFYSDNPLSAQLTTIDQAPDVVVNEGF